METCRCNGFRDDPDIFSKLNSAYKLKRRELNSVLSKASENDENVKIFMKMIEKKLTEKYYQVPGLEFLRVVKTKTILFLKSMSEKADPTSID